MSAQRLSASQTWSRSRTSRTPGLAACSTPLGVTDLVTPRLRTKTSDDERAQRLSASQTWSPRRPAPARRRSTVLNASRRHRLGHVRLGRRTSGRGAQRLSASQTWSRRRRCRHGRGRRVLNASRRHRLGHPACRFRLADACAQRLSASQTWSRYGTSRGECRTWCSTPLGVTDLVTMAARSSAAKRDVLNASRRHRLGHGGRRSGGRDGVGGAQRLSASQTWSRGVGGYHLANKMCSTPLGVTDLVTPEAPSPCDTPLMCSTPLGVTDLVTWADRGGGGGASVLNASRRHRLGHTHVAAGSNRLSRAQRLSASQTWSRAAPGNGTIRRTCSTPLGVTDLVTTFATVYQVRFYKCSTPLGVTVLGHPPPLGSSIAPLSGAQRLSASQTWSRALPADQLVVDRTCSTPLGVTDLVTARTQTEKAGEAVLNASRRHRLGHGPR